MSDHLPFNGNYCPSTLDKGQNRPLTDGDTGLGKLKKAELKIGCWIYSTTFRARDISSTEVLRFVLVNTNNRSVKSSLAFSVKTGR